MHASENTATAAMKSHNLPADYRVTLIDEDEQTHTVDIVSAHLMSDKKTMSSMAMEIITEARKNLASGVVIFEAFSGDSDYMDALDRKAETYRVEGLTKIGKTERYEVDGLYGSEGPWTDLVDGVDQEDAEFQGRWQMTLNENESKPLSIEDQLDSMEDHTIHHVTPVPVTEQELVQEVILAVKDHRSGVTGPALAARMATLAEMITSMGYHINDA